MISLVQSGNNYFHGNLHEGIVLSKAGLIGALGSVTNDEQKADWAYGYLGVIHHFDAFLLSSERIYECIQKVQRSALHFDINEEFPKFMIKLDNSSGDLSSPPCLIGLSSKAVEIELETMLLRAVSFLDRFAKIIGDKYLNQDVGSFFKLTKVLDDIETKSDGVQALIDLSNEVAPVFDYSVRAANNKTSLRNVIAHRKSTPEIMKKAFNIHMFEGNKILPFDTMLSYEDIGSFPLVGTIRLLCQYVSYYAMSAFLILMKHSNMSYEALNAWCEVSEFNLIDFEPNWKNLFVNFEEFKSTPEDGQLFSFAKYEPLVLRLDEEYLDQSVLMRCITRKQFMA